MINQELIASGYAMFGEATVAILAIIGVITIVVLVVMGLASLEKDDEQNSDS